MTSRAGHVSVVDRVEGSTVHVVEQNSYYDQPRATYALSGGTLSRSGSGTIRGVVHDPANQNAGGLSTGSFSGDGNADVLWYEVSNNGTAKMVKTNSTGSGTESSSVWFSGYAKPTWASPGDFNGDGKDDIGWYESWNNGGTLKVIPSNGSSSGTPITWFTGYSAPTLAFAADFNGDKRDDIGWYESWNDGTMKVIVTNGAGTGGASSYTWFSGYAKPDWAEVG